MAKSYEQVKEGERKKRHKMYMEMRKENETETKVDNVNHPKHYADSCSIECIDAMRITFGIKDLSKYCVINAYKYLWRHKQKNGKEYLAKANWYLDKFDSLVTESDINGYSGQIDASYIDKAITLRKLLKTANTSLESGV